MTIVEAVRALRARKISSRELLAGCLERTRANQHLNAYLLLDEDAALRAADRADHDLALGLDHGPLHGIPIGLKDLIDVEGLPTTGGSKILSNRPAAADSAISARLRRAGAVLTGKLGLHELAFGITCNNAHYGAIRNPWDPERIPGGSSGGSGVAVATGMVLGAIGSDTGGSIRIPASYCGTAGIKPTFGLVSRAGTLPLGFSLDHFGPMAQSAADCALILSSIAGYDPADPASRRAPAINPTPDYAPALEDCRIGLAEQFFLESSTPEIAAATRQMAEVAAAHGAQIRPIDLSWISEVNAISHILLPAEAAAALEPHWDRLPELGAEVRPLFELGRLIPATDYVQAQRLRLQYRRRLAALWRDYDLILTPTTPITAPRIGETTVSVAGRDIDVRAASTSFVRAWNVLGVPALSLRSGWSAGLPTSIQLIAPAAHDNQLLAAAIALEDAAQIPASR